MAETGDDTAAGDRPAGRRLPRPPRVKPSTHKRVDLAQRAGSEDSVDVASQLPDVTSGLSPAAADEARRRQENLERRRTDRALLAELAAHGFTGPRYQRFQEDLAAYGLAVMRAWLYTGHIFTLVAGRSYKLNPTDTELERLHVDPDAREELANVTVARALVRFKKTAIEGGGWKFEKGAGLTTYFMGCCVYMFPNQFRAQRRYDRRSNDARREATLSVEPLREPAIDPVDEVTRSMTIAAAMDGASDRTRKVLQLMLDNFSNREIAELLDLESDRAVEGIFYRWRKNNESQNAADRGEDDGHG